MIKVIESKVIAATAGSGAGGALAGFLLWLLGVTVWHASPAASAAAQAVAAVPAPVGALVLVLLGAVGSFVAGYIAPHTSRVPGAHSAETATSDSLTPADLTSHPILAQPLSAIALAGTPPDPGPATPLDGLPAVEPTARPNPDAGLAGTALPIAG